LTVAHWLPNTAAKRAKDEERVSQREQKEQSKLAGMAPIKAAAPARSVALVVAQSDSESDDSEPEDPSLFSVRARAPVAEPIGAQATTWSDSDSEPEDPSLATEFELAEADTLAYRSMHEAVIRSGAKMESAKCGSLSVGEVFKVLEVQMLADGMRRVRMERGWVSVTAKSGKPLCVDESMVQKFLSTVPLLQKLGDSERAAIAEELEAAAFSGDDVIVAVGEEGDSMYFLEEGAAQAELGEGDEEGSAVVMTYSAGDYFGEVSLMTNQPRAATVRAVGDGGARCLRLHRTAFDKYARGCKEILQVGSRADSAVV
jgi:hypothetical protein